MNEASQQFWQLLARQAFDAVLSHPGKTDALYFERHPKKLRASKQALLTPDESQTVPESFGAISADTVQKRRARLPDSSVLPQLLIILGLARGIATRQRLRELFEVGCLTEFQTPELDGDEDDTAKTIQTALEDWAKIHLRKSKDAEVRVRAAPSATGSQTLPSSSSIKSFSSGVTSKMRAGFPVVVVCKDLSALDRSLAQLCTVQIVAPPLDSDGILELIRTLHRPADQFTDTEVLTRLPTGGLAGISATRLEVALRQRTFKKFLKVLDTRPPTRAANSNQVTLVDVHGQPEAVAALRGMVADLRRWQNKSLRWSDGVFSAVMFGPPGNGKTLLAEAFAGSAGIPKVFTSYAECQSFGHQGDMLRALKSAFNSAIDQAPALLFIDEIDSFSQRGEGQNEQYMRGVVNGLLTEISRALRSEGVVLLAATNHLDTVDPAVIRPGRFDLRIPVKNPSVEGIRDILAHHLGAASLEIGSEQLLACARSMAGMSGAAAAAVARQALTSARGQDRGVEASDIQAVLNSSNTSDEVAYLRRIAIHEAGHAVVQSCTALPKPTKITVGRHGGVTISPAVRYHTLQSALDELCVLMAGRAAEQVCLGDVSSGAGIGRDSDLAQATQLALRIETEWHLQSSLPLWQSSEVMMTVGIPAELKARVSSRLKDAETRALEVVSINKDAVLGLANRLMEEREIVL